MIDTILLVIVFIRIKSNSTRSIQLQMSNYVISKNVNNLKNVLAVTERSQIIYNTAGTT